MSNYVIITDSSCDLSKEYRQKEGIEYARMMLNWKDENGEIKEAPADLDWATISSKEFYDLIRGAELKGSHDLVFRGVGIAVQQVLPDCPREQVRGLLHISYG